MAAPPFKPGQRIAEGTLYRRIPPWPNFFDHEEGRPERIAFRRGGHDYLSMYLKEWIAPEEVASDPPGSGVCEIDVKDVVAIGLRVTYQPEYGRAHVGIWGSTNTREVQLKLVEHCRVIIAPRVPDV